MGWVGGGGDPFVLCSADWGVNGGGGSSSNNKGKQTDIKAISNALYENPYNIALNKM